MSARGQTRQLVGFTLLGAATAWNAGNIGPAAGEIAAGLDVSLAAVGVLGGTVFFAGLVVAKLGAAHLTDRIGAGGATRVACLAAVAGNVMIAISPAFAVIAAGRLLTGLSLGLALVLGPVLARAAGGVRLVGLFGASVTIGTAAALGVGSLMRGAGVDWRIDFVVAALIALVAFAALPAVASVEISAGSVLALARRSSRRLPAWRLELLFMTALGVPYVLGVWLIPYLTDEAGFSAALAGIFGVVLYATSAVFRPEGSRLEAGGTSLTLLAGIAPLIAAAGLVLLAISDSTVAVIAGVAFAGVGFAVPYAAMYDEAERLFPNARVAAVGLFSVGANILPLAIMPAVGAAIGAGRGELALLGLAAITVLAALANLRPPAPS
ncbi:MAG: MFS transporter [Solirubrobacterales bacterium]|nr:MFS transporter [Solirubrobacterales bacterium]